MQFYLLTKYKIQSLESGLAEFVMEDILSILRGTSFKIISSSEVANKIFDDSKILKYKYLISVSLMTVKEEKSNNK